MIKNRKNAVIAWLLGLAFVNILLFCLEKGITATFWTTFGFIWFAFVSVLVYQIIIGRSTKTADDRFVLTPALMVSSIYLIVQIPVSIVFSLGSAVIPFKATLLVNALLLIVAWLIQLGAVTGNSHIREVNSRQNNHHVEL